MSLQETSSLLTSNANSIIPAFTSATTPSISNETIDILTAQNFILPNSVVDLKRKVSNLEQTQVRLLSAKEHPTKDKIISLLATILAISIIVGAVLGTDYSISSGTTAGSVGGALIPIATAFILCFLSAFYDHKWSDDGNGHIPPSSLGYLYPFAMCTIGPFIPVWRTFRGISQYQTQATTLQTEVHDNLEEAKKFFTQNQGQSNNLLDLLKKGISETETNFERVKTLSIKSPETESALSSKLEQLKKAAEELETAMTFFKE